MAHHSQETHPHPLFPPCEDDRVQRWLRIILALWLGAFSAGLSRRLTGLAYASNCFADLGGRAVRREFGFEFSLCPEPKL